MIRSSFFMVVDDARAPIAHTWMRFAAAGALAAHQSKQLCVGALFLAGVVLGAGNLSAQVNFGSAAVGATTPLTQTVTVTSVLNGESPVISSISVGTEGSTSLDFTNAGGGTCAVGQSLNTGQTCTVVVNFKPRAPGPRYGAVTLLDSDGWLIGTGFVQGTGTGPLATFLPAIESLVGHGINAPGDMVTDAAGNLYAVDEEAREVIKYTLNSGGTYARSAISLFDSYYPIGIAVDGNGNLFVADWNNENVEEYVPTGGGTYKPEDGSCCLYLSGLYTQGLAADGTGTIYVADIGNQQILKEVPFGQSGGPSGYLQSTIPLNGIYPVNVAVDASGNLFVTGNNNVLYKETLAGGSYTQSLLMSGAEGVAVDAAGDVYTSTSAGLIKLAPSGSGYTTSVVLPASVQSQSQIQYGDFTVDQSGNVYGPQNNGSNFQAIKYSTATPPSLSFAATGQGSTSLDSPQTVTVQNIGTAPLTLSAISYPPDFPERAGVATDCTTASPLAAAASCTLTIDFSPLPSTLIGTTTPLSESVSLTDNTLNRTGTVHTVAVSGTETETQTAAITSPVAGSALTGSSATFLWTPGSGVTQYSLHVGTTGAGSANVFGAAVTGQTRTVTGIPTTGATLYVRLYSFIGGAWQYNDYYYKEASPAAPATMTSPVPSSTLTGSTVTFAWTTGSQVTQYSLHVGTTGAGSSNIFGGSVTGQSKSVPGIPTTSAVLYVRLYSLIAGAWQYIDYTYTEQSPAAPAAMSSPTPGSTLTGSTVTFSWTTGSQVTQYDLHVGTTGAGSSNIFAGTVTGQSKSVPGIPTTSAALYVRLYSLIAGSWQYVDYTYTEESPAAPATMTAPAPGSTLTGSYATFAWTTGSQVTQYSLHVGTGGPGTTDIFGGVVTGQSQTVPGIPVTGGTLYVRLYSLIAGAWQYADYTYTEYGNAAPAVITSPAPGSTLTGSTVTFLWSAGSQVTQYFLKVGTTGAGSSNIFSGTETGQSQSVSGIPTTGGTLNVRLYSLINGAYQYLDYTYKEK